jgi:hypothetical protein
VVLGTAHGLWAAALIDVGLIGAACWILFFGTFFAYLAQQLLRAADAQTYCLLLGCSVVVLDTLVVGDRPPTQFWLMLGLAAGYALARAGEPSASAATVATSASAARSPA